MVLRLISMSTEISRVDLYCKSMWTQALLKKKFESLSHDFPELRVEIQSTLDQITECCKILEPESVSVPNVHDPAPESGATLEQLIFGEEEDEYEEYGDSSLRRQLHEELSEDIIPVVEQAVRDVMAFYALNMLEFQFTLSWYFLSSSLLT